MMFLGKISALLIGMVVMQAAMAVEPGVALKPDTIRNEPFNDAKPIGNLSAGDKVNIFAKDGGWLQIRSAKGNGWVRMLSIRKGEEKKQKSLADNLKGLSSGRAGTGKVVATTGIRGLSEEELKAAKFDGKELSSAESYTTSRQEAQEFANQGMLKPRAFDYLPVPQ